MAKLAVLLCGLLLLAGCSSGAGEVENMLRAPQLSSQTSSIQKALNSYLGAGTTATLKYPASGDFLSPFLFGDWDGDGTQEAAVLYTADTAGTNVWLAVLEATGETSWQVAHTAEGLSGEIESVTTAHLRDTDSSQILVGYGSAQDDRYLVVYLYSDETLQPVIKRAYTDMVIGDMTGNEETEDLVLALPTETENGGVNLELLTYVEGEFRAKQTLAVGAGSYNGCAALHAGQGLDGEPWLVLDGWAGAGGSSLASNIVRYDEESGFLQLYTPPGVWDLYGVSQRYDTSLLSLDVDGNGTIDIPSEVGDGGELKSPLDKRLKFLIWRDYATSAGGRERFGVYDSEYRFFVPLPDSMRGHIQLRSNSGSTGWLVCSEDGLTVYMELRVVDSGRSASQNSDFVRVANIGDQQLQMRLGETYYGLSVEKITAGTVMMG